MKRAPEVHSGRPLYSRLARGYGGDIAALKRLRSALLGDKRFSTKGYTRAAVHIMHLERMLKPFAKGGKGRKR